MSIIRLSLLCNVNINIRPLRPILICPFCFSHFTVWHFRGIFCWPISKCSKRVVYTSNLIIKTFAQGASFNCSSPLMTKSWKVNLGLRCTYRWHQIMAVSHNLVLDQLFGAQSEGTVKNHLIDSFLSPDFHGPGEFSVPTYEHLWKIVYS